MSTTQQQDAPKCTAADGLAEIFNVPGHPLLVRAVDFNRLHAENETLRMGYAAARLEIESLRAAQPPSSAKGVAP